MRFDMLLDMDLPYPSPYPISGYGIPYPDTGSHIRIWDLIANQSASEKKSIRRNHNNSYFFGILYMDVIAYQSISGKVYTETQNQ